MSGGGGGRGGGGGGGGKSLLEAVNFVMALFLTKFNDLFNHLTNIHGFVKSI